VLVVISLQATGSRRERGRTLEYKRGQQQRRGRIPEKRMALVR